MMTSSTGSFEIPLCDCEGCRRRLSFDGRSGMLLWRDRARLLCPDCADVYDLCLRQLGDAAGIIGGTGTTVRVYTLNAPDLPAA